MKLILGTALWGWVVPKATCFEILDEFYKNNFRKIDTATNYPINKDNKYFRFAETIIEEWISANGVNDLEITIKVGSVDNSGSPVNNLTFSFLMMSQDYYLEKFESNVDTLMIHWDNRNSEESISQSIRALYTINKKVKVGLSGIKYPEIYYKYLKDNNIISSIQIKHNLFDSYYDKYKPFLGLSRFDAYGINAGGLKLNSKYTATSSASIRGITVSSYQSYLVNLQILISNSKICNSFNDICMIYALNSPGLGGIISGTSSKGQIKETINSFKHVLPLDTSKLYHDLLNFQENEEL